MSCNSFYVGGAENGSGLPKAQNLDGDISAVKTVDDAVHAYRTF